MKISILIIALICAMLFINSPAKSQPGGGKSTYQLHGLLYEENTAIYGTNKILKREFHSQRISDNPTIPISIGVTIFLYLLNPTIMYENDKIGLGFTKELSVGFGDFGEHRIAIEPALIFREEEKYIIRFGYKYDFLMRSFLKPSNLLQGTSVISPGVNYYTDFSRSGISPEIAYGYSFRNDKLNIFPYFKLRYTYVFEKGKSNVFDFSTGLMIGIANPFIDRKIRRIY
jgi:hypothetical protein